MTKEYVPGTVGREMGSVPFGELIKNIAVGIAEGQLALDESSMKVAEFMSGQKIIYNEKMEFTDKEGNILPEDAPPLFHDSRIYFGYDFVFEGSVARATAAIGADGAITVTVNEPGSNYDFKPDVEIIGDGTGAVATVTMSNDTVSAIAVTGGEGYTTATVSISGGKMPKRKERLVSMLELGFAPNFYQFVETVIEIKIVVNMVEEQTQAKGETERTQTATTRSSSTRSRASANFSWWRGYSYSGSYSRTQNSKTLTTKSVDPAMTSKYNYSIEGSSSVRTKLVPIPPPAILEERVRTLMEMDKEYQQALLKKGVV